MLFGYIAILVAVGTFAVAGLMLLVALIRGLSESKNKPEVPDPLEGEPDVFSAKLPPLGADEVTPPEGFSLKLAWAPILFALTVLLAIFGFSGYGLMQMSNSSRTTAALKKEGMQKAKAMEKRRAGYAAIEDEETPSAKKKNQLFQVAPNTK